MSDTPTGYDVLHSAALNKSTAFSRRERDVLRLRGLLPYRVNDVEKQEVRVLENIRRKDFDIERYIFLISLLERNETLFFRTVINNIEELMPLIYTPTVGQACKEFAHIFRRPHGFYITPEDRGSIREILDNWPEDDVRVIVVTDGHRILGLGDLGANGMGIPVGKLSLYVACAGIHPHQCLPVMLDIGTNNQELLDDPLYLGYPAKRIEGTSYDELVEEFVQAVFDRYPNALLQFEDFLTPNAFKLLDTYRDRVLCFNDDIQGTAAVVLAGVLASLRITKIPFNETRIMFLGAGSAATGIGDLIVSSLVQSGLSEAEARGRLWFNDSQGLIVAGRENLAEHKLPYAHEHEHLGLIDAIVAIKPHILIGATGSPGAFSREVIEAMSAVVDQPAIFALSNPTSKAECTAEQAYEWSDGKAIFASGSPFDPVDYKGTQFRPGQGNNAYIFPGIGLGAIACQAKSISDEMFLASAEALAAEVSEEDLAEGAVYPPLNTIRAVSLRIAVALARKAWEQGLATIDHPDDLEAHIEQMMYTPEYPDLAG